jgi:hypothetical protein
MYKLFFCLLFSSSICIAKYHNISDSDTKSIYTYTGKNKLNYPQINIHHFGGKDSFENLINSNSKSDVDLMPKFLNNIKKYHQLFSMIIQKLGDIPHASLPKVINISVHKSEAVAEVRKGKMILSEDIFSLGYQAFLGTFFHELTHIYLRTILPQFFQDYFLSLSQYKKSQIPELKKQGVDVEKLLALRHLSHSFDEAMADYIPAIFFKSPSLSAQFMKQYIQKFYNSNEYDYAYIRDVSKSSSSFQHLPKEYLCDSHNYFKTISYNLWHEGKSYKEQVYPIIVSIHDLLADINDGYILQGLTEKKACHQIKEINQRLWDSYQSTY